VVGLVLDQGFAIGADWVPEFIKMRASGWGDRWRQIILPVGCLGTIGAANNGRMARVSGLEVIGQDYIRTARAKGLSERIVTYRHALKNALIPVITVVGLEFGAFLGGAVITET